MSTLYGYFAESFIYLHIFVIFYTFFSPRTVTNHTNGDYILCQRVPVLKNTPTFRNNMSHDCITV